MTWFKVVYNCVLLCWALFSTLVHAQKSKSQQNHIENHVEVNGDEVSKFKVQRSSHQHEHIMAIIAGNWLFILSHQHNMHLFILGTLPKIQSRKCYNVLYLPLCVCYIGYISTCMWMCSVGPNNCFLCHSLGWGNFCDIHLYQK